MTREEAIEYLKRADTTVGKKMKTRTAEALEMAIQSLTAISELSKSLKAVNRYEMDEKVLIGFNMAVAIFNKCFGEIGEKSENQTDGDLISLDFMKKLGATCIAKRSETGELVAISSIDNLPSADKTAEWKPLDKEKAQYYMFGYVCSKCGAPAKSPTKYCSNCGANMHGGNSG